MTKHSKNSTAHSVYSYHERQKDKQRDQNERLGKDSFKPFECCCLSLQPASDPVVTPEGYLYDRQVILEYILNTKASIKRKISQYNKQKTREEQQLKDVQEALKKEELKSFLSYSDVVPSRNSVAVEKSKLTSAQCDYNPGGPCDFWSGPQGSHQGKLSDSDKPDEVVRCPMSNNPIKYKDLIPVNFIKYKKEDNSKSVSNALYCCAVSNDIITDATQCVVLKTSGSIVTQEVSDKIIKKEMIDPINSKKLTDADFIPLYRGSLGFTDERILLKAKRNSDKK